MHVLVEVVIISIDVFYLFEGEGVVPDMDFLLRVEQVCLASISGL